MKKEYSTIDELIRNELDLEEEYNTARLIKELKSVKRRGYFTREEFIKMGMWKSPRPKRHYEGNSEDEILEISRSALSSTSEERKIEYLVELKGVSVPTASAILTLIDPVRYGVIDIRVWQVLYLYGSVNTKPEGVNFDFDDWQSYLAELRGYANKFEVSTRDIERTLFLHHKNIQEGNLYKYGKQ